MSNRNQIIASVRTMVTAILVFFVAIILPILIYMATYNLPFIQPWLGFYNFVWVIVSISVYMSGFLWFIATFEHRFTGSSPPRK